MSENVEHSLMQLLKKTSVVHTAFQFLWMMFLKPTYSFYKPNKKYIL